MFKLKIDINKPFTDGPMETPFHTYLRKEENSFYLHSGQPQLRWWLSQVLKDLMVYQQQK